MTSYAEFYIWWRSRYKHDYKVVFHFLKCSSQQSFYWLGIRHDMRCQRQLCGRYTFDTFALAKRSVSFPAVHNWERCFRWRNWSSRSRKKLVGRNKTWKKHASKGANRDIQSDRTNTEQMWVRASPKYWGLWHLPEWDSCWPLKPRSLDGKSFTAHPIKGFGFVQFVQYSGTLRILHG